MMPDAVKGKAASDPSRLVTASRRIKVVARKELIVYFCQIMRTIVT